jgi:hypothetical protein
MKRGTTRRTVLTECLQHILDGFARRDGAGRRNERPLPLSHCPAWIQATPRARPRLVALSAMARSVSTAVSCSRPGSAARLAATSAASSIVTPSYSSRLRRSQRAATRGCRRGSLRAIKSVSSSASLRLSPGSSRRNAVGWASVRECHLGPRLIGRQTHPVSERREGLSPKRRSGRRNESKSMRPCLRRPSPAGHAPAAGCGTQSRHRRCRPRSLRSVAGA